MFATRGHRSGGAGRRLLRRRGAIGILIAVVVVGAVAPLGLAQSAPGGQIPRGVEVGGVPVGGKTPGEAERAVRERVAELEEIRVSGGGQEVVLQPEELGVETDVRASVEGASRVGREGNLFERFGDSIETTFGMAEVPLQVDHDAAALDRRVADIERELEDRVRPAGIRTGDGEVELVSSREGYRVDPDETSRNVREAIESLEGEADLAGEVIEPAISTAQAEDAAEDARRALEEPAVFTSGAREWRLAPSALSRGIEFEEEEDGQLELAVDPAAMNRGLAAVYSDLNSEARDADFRFSGDSVEVVPSQTGSRVDQRQLLDSLEEGLPEGRHEFEVPVAETRPELTTQQAEKQRPTQKIGTYRTTYEGTGDDDPERVENLGKASRALTGQTIAPDEVFSVVDVLEPLNYNETKVFIDGRVEEAEGGGLCQVSSTLYMAVNYAGLDVVERYPHFAMLNYIRPGLDATVWFGRDGGQELDMRFRNTSDGYVMLREYVDEDGYLYAEVWGQPTGREVTMRSVDRGTTEESSTWDTYQRVENADGETLFDGLLHTDTYEAVETDEGSVSPDEVEPAPVNP